MTVFMFVHFSPVITCKCKNKLDKITNRLENDQVNEKDSSRMILEIAIDDESNAAIP